MLAGMLSLVLGCEPETGPLQSLVPQPSFKVLPGHELVKQELCVGDGSALDDRLEMIERRQPDEDGQDSFTRDITHKGPTQLEGAGVRPARIDALHPQTTTDNPLRKYPRKNLFVLEPVLRPLGHDFPEPIALDEVGRNDFHEASRTGSADAAGVPPEGKAKSGGQADSIAGVMYVTHGEAAHLLARSIAQSSCRLSTSNLV